MIWEICHNSKQVGQKGVGEVSGKVLALVFQKYQNHQVILGNLQKHVLTNHSPRKCENLPAHLNVNVPPDNLLKVV